MSDLVEQARQRLERSLGEQLREEDLTRLAPQLAELAAGLAALEQALAPETEPAPVQRITPAP